MTRHEHKKQIGNFFAQPLKDFCQQLFLAVVGAPADQNGRAGFCAGLTEQVGDVEIVRASAGGGIKFQAAQDSHRVGAASQFPQPLRIGLSLRADPGKRGEERPKEKPESFITRKRTIRYSRIHEKQGGADL